MSTARPSPEEIVAGVENTGKDILPRVHFGLFFLLDLAYYTALIWRPYGEQPYQMTVIHYIGFLLSSDPLAYFLSDRRAHWWNVFRFVDSIQSVQATVALWIMGLDGGVLWLSAARVALGAVRLLHSGVMLRRYGPFLSHWVSLYEMFRAFYEQGGRAQSVWRKLAQDVVVIFCLNEFAYYTHWNYGEPRIDGTLIMMQAINAFTVKGKLLVMQLLLTTPRTRGIAMAISSVFLVGSWPVMPKLFINAPTTFVPHAIHDLGFVVQAYWLLSGQVESPGSPFEPAGKSKSSPLPQPRSAEKTDEPLLSEGGHSACS